MPDAADKSAMAQRAHTGGLRLCLLLVPGGSLFAEDPFDIHVYQYETLLPGAFTLEQHMNYVGSGTKAIDGNVAPTNDQLHMSYELTAGVTDFFSIGGMDLNAVRLGGLGWSTRAGDCCLISTRRNRGDCPLISAWWPASLFRKR